MSVIAILKHDLLEVKCENCIAIIFSLIYVISCKCSKPLEKRGNGSVFIMTFLCHISLVEIGGG